MAGRRLWSALGVLCLLLVQGTLSSSGEVVSVTWDNFTAVQEGEWMLEFFAPWCGACKQFASTWESFADRMEGSDAGVGKVDVTQETMLSGRFMITQLPSLFHIHDGEVREYTGGRSVGDLVAYVEGEKWKNEDPISFWKSPTASHMHLIGTIFWLAEQAREWQIALEKDYSLPNYAIFILIALATIVFGLLLGGVTVCMIEMCMRFFTRREPTANKPKPLPQEGKVSSGVVNVGPRNGEKEGGGVRKRTGKDGN